MKQLRHFFKGMAIGATMMIPGVSGGTMALILGIYNDIIGAISNIFKEFKKHAVFLLVVGAGSVLGLVAISWIVDYFLKNFNNPTMFLFCGIVVGGFPVLFKEANVGERKKTDFIWLVIGFLIVGGLMYLDAKFDKSLFTFTSLSVGSFIYLFIAGIVVSVALILPGISTSFLLLALGLLEPTMEAIKTYNLAFLAPLLIGVLFGVMATTKLLESLMKNKPRPTYLMIIGFVIASLIEVFPCATILLGVFTGDGQLAINEFVQCVPKGWELLICFVTFVAGYLLIRFVSKRFAN